MSVLNIDLPELSVDTNTEFPDIENTVNNFIQVIRKIYLDVEIDFKKYLDNPQKDILTIVHKKYPHLKRQRLSKRTQKIEAKACICEILEKPEYSKYIEGIVSIHEKTLIYKYCIKKIKGVYKHAQALKTGYCNLQIINSFSEKNTISICITKNTLEANEQWLERLFKELDIRFPKNKLKDKIMIISSKKNILDGNATHCKDINTAWKYLKRENEFKIIFVCSNKIRLSDILEMSEDFQNLNSDLQKNIRILHDEAHNLKEGIPAFRYLIENILIQPNVLCYTPITASNNSICDEDNALWRKENIENFAANYANFDKTKSSDPHFSSCSKSTQITFETLKNNPNWINYGIEKLPKQTFISIHTNEIRSARNKLSLLDKPQLIEKINKEIDLFVTQNISNTDDCNIISIRTNKEVYSNNELIEHIIMINIERRRTLEFCDFMKNDNEIEAVNSGLNCLNMNHLLDMDYYTPNDFNIYIISTPNRRSITRFLCEEAVKKNYNPIVLGVYGNEGDKYHLMYDNTEMEVSHVMNKGEFNVKLDKLFTYLKEQNINISRPFIVIGNYNPTGESLTFVNYTYGVVKGNIRLISTNAEEDYQEGSRSNYMATKFIENNPNWIMPEKFLIGPKRFIDNALSYEMENDARICSMLLTNNSNEAVVSSQVSSSMTTLGGTVAIPIKIIVDRSDPLVIEIIEIAEKSRRTNEDKILFLAKLKDYVDSGECTFEDKTCKFNFDRMSLKDFRSYKKKENQPEKGVWKFTNYQNHFMIGTPFINSINHIEPNECEILTCIDTYILHDASGKEIEKNLKSIWWIGYKYQ